MAQYLARCIGVSRALRLVSPPNASSAKCFSTSSILFQRRPKVQEDMTRRTRSVLEDDSEDLWEQIEESPDVHDSPSVGHIILQQQRVLLQYMRLIEHEMPKLVAFRKPFNPPTSETPLIVRSMHYQGESHPATAKRVIVVAVDALPLKDAKAIHKFKLIAGPRWTPQPPKDAGVNGFDDWGNGYFKISCEDFPKPAQNLKWASDKLDKLVAVANNSSDTFEDLPLDLRHVVSKIRKGKKGDHLGGRAFHRPSILDFPKEWLPQSTTA